MRERQQLDTAISRYQRLESQLNDNVELIEMGEADGDEEIITEAEAALKLARIEIAQAEIE